MSNNNYRISKIEIKSLWGKFDLTWKLDTDVNILSGKNGSGKSTILSCIAGLITVGSLAQEHQNLIESATITFVNGKQVVFEHIKDTIKNLERKAQMNAKYKAIFSEIKANEGADFKKIKSISFGLVSFGDNIKKSLDELHKFVDIDIISTFDNQIPDVGSKPDILVKTELDRDIFRLQKQYLDYQLNMSKRKDLIIDKDDINVKEAMDELRYPQNRFLEIIDTLFKETGKKIDRTNNEIAFLFDDIKLTPYQLSSGEKQLLVILLTVLIEDNKPSIIFMDEPEISLHFDWQKELIGYIRELNPNIQIIIATHSPALVMNGWLDKVSEVSDLIDKNPKA